MTPATVLGEIEQLLGIVAAACLLLLVIVWGVVKAEHLSDEVLMRHEGRTWRRR